MIRGIIFDLDGTLLDTLSDLTDSTNYIMKIYGMPEHTVPEVRGFVGNGIRKLIERAVPGDTALNMDAEAYKLFIDKLYLEFSSYYDIHCLDKTLPYPGIMDLLQALSSEGYKLAIVSNKVDSAVKELSESFFSEYISVAIGETPSIKRKPAPDTAFAAMKELGLSASECIYVGDSEVDIATAENAGLRCISVTWGFKTKAFLADHGAKLYADTPGELKSLISELT